MKNLSDHGKMIHLCVAETLTIFCADQYKPYSTVVEVRSSIPRAPIDPTVTKSKHSRYGT